MIQIFLKILSLNLENNTLIINVEENKIIQTVFIEGVKSNRIKEINFEKIIFKR